MVKNEKNEYFSVMEKLARSRTSIHSPHPGKQRHMVNFNFNLI